MTIYVFAVLMFTSFGRLEYAKVHGVPDGQGIPWTLGQCNQEREDYLNSDFSMVASSNPWKIEVTRCFPLDSTILPRCE